MAQKKRKKGRKGITASAKKKTSVARAVIKKGTGKIKINKRALEVVEPVQVREFIREPLEFAPELAGNVDISVDTKGGGFMGQAVAARAAIAKSLLEFRSNEKLKKAFLNYDRMLLVDDPRRVESKKPLGTKARKKKQKSKR
ncbi:MAG: small subunit ribosomal protein S9 [archaeon GW2011_AR10]|nr:MAG: small subunit ribosomal protein S9 [archaeon GW2011_AR10]